MTFMEIMVQNRLLSVEDSIRNNYRKPRQSLLIKSICVSQDSVLGGWRQAGKQSLVKGETARALFSFVAELNEGRRIAQVLLNLTHTRTDNNDSLWNYPRASRYEHEGNTLRHSKPCKAIMCTLGRRPKLISVCCQGLCIIQCLQRHSGWSQILGLYLEMHCVRVPKGGGCKGQVLVLGTQERSTSGTRVIFCQQGFIWMSLQVELPAVYAAVVLPSASKRNWIYAHIVNKQNQIRKNKMLSVASLPEGT